jgi:hypothetical protein
MKRYMLLVGDLYYPAGFEDFAGMFDSVESARTEGRRRMNPGQWFEVFDLKREATVESGERPRS